MKKLRNFALQLSQKFIQHDVLTLSAALAFYTALSFAPLLIIMVYVLGALGFEAQNALLLHSRSLMGEQASGMIEIVITNINQDHSKSSLAGYLALGVLIFLASGVFAQLQYSVNSIWESQPLETAKAEIWAWAKKRFFSIVFVFLFAIFALLSILTSTLLSFLFTGTGGFLKLFNFIGTVLIFTIFFRTIFYYLPDERQVRTYTWYGGLFTALLFVPGKDLIGKYLGTSAFGSAYGTAGLLLILLSWVYYSAIIVFLGAVFTRTLQIQQKITK